MNNFYSYFNYDYLVKLVDLFFDASPFKLIISIFVIMDMNFVIHDILKGFKKLKDVPLITLRIVMYLLTLIYLINLSILWGIIMFVFLTAFFIQLGRGQYQDAMLKQVNSIIQVDGNKVMINKLPENYYYKDLKGNRIGYDEDVLNGQEKQVLIFEEDKTYNVSYLIDKYGRKYELNEEDTKFLKERGVK